MHHKPNLHVLKHRSVLSSEMPVTYTQGIYVDRFVVAVFKLMSVKKENPDDPPIVRSEKYPERAKWMIFIANCCDKIFNPLMPLRTGDRVAILSELGKAIRKWLFNGLDTFQYYSAPDERTAKVMVTLPGLQGSHFLTCRVAVSFELITDFHIKQCLQKMLILS
jgi:hypothetical protein